MKLRVRFIFVVSYLTAVLILTAYLRGADDRVFHKIYRINIEQGRLQQQLWQKQLQLENLTNPTAVSECVEY